MICSIPTVKSGSTWLDRLRSTKGFPTADGLDLGHFLLSNSNNQNSNPESDPNPNSPESTQSDDKPAVADNRKQISTGRNGGVAADDDDDGGGGGGGESEWFGIMSNVLSDLFNMNNGGGEADRRRRKKSLRKQRNPRICLIPTAAAAVEAEAVVEEEEERSSGGCERKDENALAENNNAVVCEEEEEESGGGERELLGFSRNEVTVIDTSCVEWKFEKLVYRKRNVWKVREKKGKSKFVGRKRRKGGGGSEDGKKKMKLSNENVGVGGGGCVSPFKNVSLLVMMLIIYMFLIWKKMISYGLDCLFGYVRHLDCDLILKWGDL